MNCSPKRIRVAAVEDKLAFRRGLQAILGLTANVECVGMYSSAEDAVQQLPLLQPQVVLVDLNLPGASGVECTAKLRKTIPAIQIIILTIEADGERVFAALRAGASGYLLKTATPGEIISAIELVAQGGAPMSALIARRVVESFHGQAAVSLASERLSPREKQVLDRISHGRRVKEVATDLGISTATVQTFLRRIYEKLQVNSQAEAVARFLR
jgi:DNA-binding NarL/FixJ family response regulator